MHVCDNIYHEHESINSGIKFIRLVMNILHIQHFQQKSPMIFNEKDIIVYKTVIECLIVHVFSVYINYILSLHIFLIYARLLLYEYIVNLYFHVNLFAINVIEFIL